jgi:serine/threonine protein kinase
MSAKPGDRSFYYVDMELASYDLKAFISRHQGSDSPTNLLKAMREIVLGVQFVHQKGIVIRDLHPGRGLSSSARSLIVAVLFYRNLERWKLGDISLVIAEGPEDLDGDIRDDTDAVSRTTH